MIPADRTSVVLMYSGAGEDLKVRDTVRADKEICTFNDCILDIQDALQ